MMGDAIVNTLLKKDDCFSFFPSLLVCHFSVGLPVVFFISFLVLVI